MDRAHDWIAISGVDTMINIPEAIKQTLAAE